MLLGLACQALMAQNRSVQFVPEVEKAFKNALTRYVSKDYAEALSGFQPLARSEILHHRMTGSLLMTGKSLYQLGRYADALPYFDRLINSFPKSKYLDDAYYARASAYYRLQDYHDATRDFLYVVEQSPQQQLVERSGKIAGHLIRNELSGSDLRRLLRYVEGEKSAVLVTLALARKQILNGATEDAVSLLRNYQKEYGANEYAGQIDQLIKEAKTAVNRPVKLGVLLPLSGIYRREGRGVLRGIKFAHNQATNGSESMIQLVYRDSESSMIKALHGIKDLVHREHVRAVIGEMESSVTAGIGALASVAGVPVLAPAATENGVASVGRTLFQLNSDLEQKGRALAEYAVNELGMQTFATLAPADEYGRQMVASFTSTIDELDGRVIAQSWYYGTPEDLSRQFKIIREAAFLHDSTDVQAILREAAEEGEKMDETDIPVNSIDGFFIPIDSEDIKYVAPNMALNNIRSQLLGGEYFDDLDVLRDAQVERYVNGVIFVSDYFPDENDLAFRDFRTRFRLEMKKTPERWEVFGYDAYQILRNIVENGAKSASRIADELNNLNGYQAMKGAVSFRNHHRVNRAVNILQFINGRIVKHEPKGENHE